MMKHVWTTTLLCSLLFALSVSPVAAQDSGSPSAELREIIKQRIEQTLQEKKLPTTQNRVGILGTITKVGQNTFTLRDLQGKERTVEVPELTPLILSGKNVALKDLTINSGAAVMGDLRDELIVEAKRILLLDQPPVEKRTIILGTISRIDRTNLTITKRGTEEQITVPLTTTTRYEDVVGLAIKRENLQVDQAALVVTSPDKNDKLTTKRVHLLIKQTDVTPSPAVR